MDEVKQRVVDELNELSERTSNIVKFTLSEKFSSLSINMQCLMKEQIDIMLNYGDVLRRRLACWNDERWVRKQFLNNYVKGMI